MLIQDQKTKTPTAPPPPDRREVIRHKNDARTSALIAECRRRGLLD